MEILNVIRRFKAWRIALSVIVPVAIVDLSWFVITRFKMIWWLFFGGSPSVGSGFHSSNHSLAIRDYLVALTPKYVIIAILVYGVSLLLGLKRNQEKTPDGIE